MSQSDYFKAASAWLTSEKMEDFESWRYKYINSVFGSVYEEKYEEKDYSEHKKSEILTKAKNSCAEHRRCYVTSEPLVSF